MATDLDYIFIHFNGIIHRIKNSEQNMMTILFFTRFHNQTFEIFHYDLNIKYRTRNMQYKCEWLDYVNSNWYLTLIKTE